MCWTRLISRQMKRPEECSTHMRTVMHVCALLSTKETISVHAWIFISAIPFKCIFCAGSAHWRSLKNVHTANMEHTKIYMGVCVCVGGGALCGGSCTLHLSYTQYMLTCLHAFWRRQASFLLDFLNYSRSFGKNKALCEIRTREHFLISKSHIFHVKRSYVLSMLHSSI